MGGGVFAARHVQPAGRSNPLLCRPDQHAWRFKANRIAPLADDGRGGGDGRHAAVRHQHCLHLRGDAGLLVTHNPPPPSLS